MHGSLEILNRLSYYERQIQFEATCKRDGFIITVICQVFTEEAKGADDKYHFVKWGQLPSLADLQRGQLKNFTIVLNKKYFQEYTKATGLFAHGIGIGSFVYLRRIFEFLVYEVKDLHSKDIRGWDEKQFQKARMPEKIEILKQYLPPFLVASKGIYSILSKGLHELEEDECKEFFPAVKEGISIILEQRVRQKEEQKQLEQAAKILSQIQNKIGESK